MFRQMNRVKQLLSNEDAISVLERNTSGVLSLSGDEGYPYGVPLSYVYSQGKIYFHCAKKGYKLDCIMNNPKVSFTVIDEDTIVPEEYTTYFRSVICFGVAQIIEAEDEKRKAIEILAEKYSPEQVEGRKKEIEGSINNMHMVKIDIDFMSGKEAIEYVRAKGK